MPKKTPLMEEYERETGKHAIWAGKTTNQFKQWKTIGHQIKKKRKIIKEKEEEIQALTNEVVRKEKRVYTRKEKIKRWLKLTLLIYLFILGIAFLKQGVISLSSESLKFLTNNLQKPKEAFLTSWFIAALTQSGSIIALINIILSEVSTLNTNLLFWSLTGVLIGNTTTSLLIALFTKPRNNHELRHGFEIGIMNLVNSIILVILLVIIELTTNFYTNLTITLNDSLKELITSNLSKDSFNILTKPVINLINYLLGLIPLNITNSGLIIIGSLTIIYSLKLLSNVIIDLLGGKRHTRALVSKYLSKDHMAFLIGMGLTIVLASNSVTLSLIVPLAVIGLIKLRQAIPYALGTIAGSFIDVLISSIIIGTPFTISAGLMFTLISLTSIIFIINPKISDLIHKLSRFLCRKIIRVNKKTIMLIISLMIITPLIILII